MMIRSCRIPTLLSRVCDDGIKAAMVVTIDGELLGSAQADSSSERSDSSSSEDVSSLGALATEIAADYSRLGNNELMMLDAASPPNRQFNNLNCLVMEFEDNLVAVSSAGQECLVIAKADPSVPLGKLRARLTALASHVQEALSPLTEQTS